MPAVLSLDKTLDILEAIAEADDGMGTRPLARRLGYNVATVHNIADTLKARGYLRQHPVTKRFEPGLRLMMLGRHGGFLDAFSRLAEPHVRALASDLKDTVMLVALDMGRAVKVAYLPAENPAHRQEPEDLGDCAYCTACGKMMLAAMDDATLEAYMAETPLHAFTPVTLATREAIRAEAATIRERGHAIARDELTPGVTAAAVPLYNPWGGMVAAVGASAPSSRMTPRRLNHVLRKLRAAADAVSAYWAAGKG